MSFCNFVSGFAICLSVSSWSVPAQRAIVFPFSESVNANVAPQGRNSIYGTVFGESRRPVADVYVELLDDVNATLRQVRTDASGRFTFTGLVDGRYIVKVMPYGTDYMEQTQEVVLSAVSSVRGSGSDTQHIDINLKVNERAAAGPFAAVAPGVVFAQDVPPEAKKRYEVGVRLLREKKEEEAFDSLKKALEIFPDYYLALDRLGAEYALRGATKPAYLQAGFVLLAKAVEVNPDGFSSVFGLGWVQYQLGLNTEAVESLQKATQLYTKAPDAYLWLGKALRRVSRFDEAEVALKRANDLTKGKVSDVHRQLAAVYIDQKRYSDAADELEIVLKEESNPADADAIKATIIRLKEKAAPKQQQT
jgi:Flp pilus assembly protein TadD